MGRWREFSASEHAADLVFFLFKMGESLLEPSLGLYIYQCVCFDHDRTAVDAGAACANLSHYPELENQVQTEAADYMIANKVLLNFPAIIVGLFCGAWSDVIGRRVPVFMTLAASFIANILYLGSLVPSGPTGQRSALALVLVGAAIRGSVGKSAVITMALYSYVCDIAPRAQRTKKIGRLLSMNYFGFFVGSMTAGALLEFHGFYVIFAAVMVLHLTSALAAIRLLKTREQIEAERLEAEMSTSTTATAADGTVMPFQTIGNGDGEKGGGGGPGMNIRDQSDRETDGIIAGDEVRRRQPVEVASGQGQGQLAPAAQKTTTDQLSHAAEKDGHQSSWSSTLMASSPFRLSYVRDSVAVLTRSRPDHDRLHVVALFCTLFAIQTCRAGEMEATLLFAERAPLSWKKSMYGYLLATDYAGLGISTLFILPFLIRWLHLVDMSMVLIGVVFRIVRLVILAASTSTFGIYFSVIVGAPSSLIVSCSKALISKTIHASELGKAFALVSCAEPVSNLVGSVVFNTVYRATFDQIYPGFVFALEVGFFVLLLGALGLLWFDVRRHSTASGAQSYGALREETQLRSPASVTPFQTQLPPSGSPMATSGADLFPEKSDPASIFKQPPAGYGSAVEAANR